MKQLKINVDSEFTEVDIKKTHENEHEAIFVLTISKEQKKKIKRYVFDEIDESDSLRKLSEDDEYLLVINPSFHIMRLLADTSQDFFSVKLVKTEEI